MNDVNIAPSAMARSFKVCHTLCAMCSFSSPHFSLLHPPGNTVCILHSGVIWTLLSMNVCSMHWVYLCSSLTAMTTSILLLPPAQSWTPMQMCTLKLHGSTRLWDGHLHDTLKYCHWDEKLDHTHSSHPFCGCSSPLFKNICVYLLEVLLLLMVVLLWLKIFTRQAYQLATAL